jgi:hypothetical protein
VERGTFCMVYRRAQRVNPLTTPGCWANSSKLQRKAPSKGVHKHSLPTNPFLVTKTHKNKNTSGNVRKQEAVEVGWERAEGLGRVIR